MKNANNILILLVSILCIISGCKRTQDDYMGPGLGYASKDFAIISNLTTSADTIDFKKNPKLDFTAKFNEKVAYTITVTGTVSGGTKHLKGFSSQVSISWMGNSELYFFIKETCKIELTVLGNNSVLATRSLVIVGTYNPEGTVIANMEPGGHTCGVGFWDSYYDPATKKNYAELLACQPTKAITPPLEGLNAWKSEGVDLKGGGFVGLSYVIPDFKNGINYGPLHYFFKTNTANPDSLWFNIFIYGTGDVNAATYIKFMQDDNGDGTHDPKSENGFEQKILDLSHIGWKLFSFRYSNILLGGNSDYGGSGDNIHRPDKIVQIELALWSLQKGAHVKFIYDYPVFTVGKPFGQ
jgi:hypothetical protein